MVISGPETGSPRSDRDSDLYAGMQPPALAHGEALAGPAYSGFHAHPLVGSDLWASAETSPGILIRASPVTASGEGIPVYCAPERYETSL